LGRLDVPALRVDIGESRRLYSDGQGTPPGYSLWGATEGELIGAVAEDWSPLTLLGNPEFLALAAVRFSSGMASATIIIALAFYADQFAVSGVIAGLFGTVYAGSRLLLVLPVG